uniref:Uncharacterized protein n=1 Tax=Siphoviridae sp. ctwIM10 TaxID=2825728 RepID=A0A8S5U875_9CAUD|nr:MAG TPA: hypothetical protein [Siphoviridae sp. ctwIM10]
MRHKFGRHQTVRTIYFLKESGGLPVCSRVANVSYADCK